MTECSMNLMLDYCNSNAEIGKYMKIQITVFKKLI